MFLHSSLLIPEMSNICPYAQSFQNVFFGHFWFKKITPVLISVQGNMEVTVFSLNIG